MNHTTKLTLFSALVIATLTLQAHAGCYTQDCSPAASQPANAQQSVGYAAPQTQQAEQNQTPTRNQSHDFGDVSNANAGWIHVGHTDTHFENIGDQATIDNTINATFIFGDVQQ